MRRFAKLLLAVIAVLATAVAAFAYWSSSGAGAGGGTIGSMTPPTNVTVPENSNGSHTVSWQAATVSNPDAAEDIKYIVERKETNDPNASWEAAGDTCAGTLDFNE